MPCLNVWDTSTSPLFLNKANLVQLRKTPDHSITSYFVRVLLGRNHFGSKVITRFWGLHGLVAIRDPRWILWSINDSSNTNYDCYTDTDNCVNVRLSIFSKFEKMFQFYHGVLLPYHIILCVCRSIASWTCANHIISLLEDHLASRYSCQYTTDAL